MTIRIASQTIYSKNTRCIELKRYVTEFAKNPKMLYQCPMKAEKRLGNISKCFQIIRDFHKIDKSSISTNGLRGLSTLSIYDQIHFQRSFEDVRNFQCSTNTEKMYLACIIYRSLHLYDFIRSKHLFSVKLSNIINPTTSTQHQNTLFFMDSDQLIVVQDGRSRLVVVSISAMIELQARK